MPKWKYKCNPLTEIHWEMKNQLLVDIVKSGLKHEIKMQMDQICLKNEVSSYLNPFSNEII